MIHISNKTTLPYEVIGKVFDKYLEKQADLYTCGAIEYELFEYKKKEYKMTIEHKTNCISILVEELDIETKKISKNGIKFPKTKNKY